MATTDNDNILMMFEEINQKLDRTNQQIEKVGQKQPESTSSIDSRTSEKLAKILTMSEIINDNQSEMLNKVEKIVRKERKKIDLSPNSMNALLIWLFLSLVILGFVQWNTSLNTQLRLYFDNDLKYRYIQMIGHATDEELATLDTIFYFNRNSKNIKSLRKQVETFEKNVEERAKIIEREEQLKIKKEDLERQLSVN